ncbi:MAG: hypothetical protein AAB217_04365 [Chloroflexota bacterium]
MNRRRLLIAALLLLMLTACQPTPAPLPLPTVTPPALPGTSATTGNVVTGSVVLADGSCCVGGVAGSTVDIKASFYATSSASKVGEMRVASAGVCWDEIQMAGAAWEPFAAKKTIPFANIPINFVGFYMTVQYRDGAGNTSPVYCDEVSVEGIPPVTP